MLPRRDRLRRSSDIQAVVKGGRRKASSWLVIHIRPNRGLGFRAACIVGKQVSTSAVVRHRYQRWLRELARETSHTSPWGENIDTVWVARAAIKTFPTLAALRQAVYQSLL